MTIIQELPSNNGMLRVRKCHNVIDVSLRDNYMLGGILQNVIVCKTKYQDSIIGYFPSNYYRELAFKYIVNNDKSIVKLDLCSYFCRELLEDSEVEKFLHKETLFTNLQWALQFIENHNECDAFHFLDKTLLTAIKLGVPTPVNNANLANLWAKTLKVKYTYLKLGITKRQFFNHLITKNYHLFNP